MATGDMATEAGAGTAIGATGKEATGLATDIDGAAAAVAGAVAVAIIGAAADVTGLCTDRDGCPRGGCENHGHTTTNLRRIDASG